jgi:hypothetical protein
MDQYEKLLEMYQQKMKDSNLSFEISFVMYKACLMMIRSASKDDVEALKKEMSATVDIKNTLSPARKAVIESCDFRLDCLEFEAEKNRMLSFLPH